MRVEDVNEEMIDAGMVVLTEFLEWENYPYEDRDLIGAIIRAAVKAYVPKPPPAKRRVRGADQAGFVYFIKSGNYIKIGKAKDVRSRMSGIQTGAPERLECLGIIAGGLRKEQPAQTARLVQKLYSLAAPEFSAFIIQHHEHQNRL